MSLVFDKNKAINGELIHRGIIPIKNIFINLQVCYATRDEEGIKILKNVFDSYMNDENKDKINLVYINKDEDYWTFIEDE